MSSDQTKKTLNTVAEGQSNLHTLAKLESGELDGVKRLNLSEQLDEFPLNILRLADSLEVLDLSNNQLSSLPEEITQLVNLKVFFAGSNCFEEVPEVLGRCPSLEMIGFKGNRISEVSGAALPPNLRWLILTENCLTTLPDALGERPRLQKLALAGNRLPHLPDNLHQLHNLELLRISANELRECPTQLFDLPRLAWFAFGGNPFSRSDIKVESVPEISSSEYTLGEVLGQGASGVISKAHWNTPQDSFPEEIAVKVFKGEVTSDGYPEDELQACMKVGNHPNLVKALAQVNEPDYSALVMSLIPHHFQNLGLPPSLESCTRDTFPEGFSLTIDQISKIVDQMEAVFEHMHENQVCHGDLYAHNTLFDDDANIIFGDFGAATMEHMLTEEQQEQVRTIERRALGFFIDDLLSVCLEADRASTQFGALQQRVKNYA